MTEAGLSDNEFRLLDALPRTGAPVGALPQTDRGDTKESVFPLLAKRGLCAMWPFKGWCITEDGIQAVDRHRAAMQEAQASEASE